MSEWQPIETAPLRKEVLILELEPDCLDMAYIAILYEARPDFGLEAGWYESGHEENGPIDAAYWMPIPPPPPLMRAVLGDLKDANHATRS